MALPVGWVAPKEWVIGEVLTAADMNQYVSANENALRYAPACVAYRTTGAGAIGLAAATWTNIPLDAEYMDQAEGGGAGVMHNGAGPNPERITIAKAGIYLCGFELSIDGAAGYRLAQLMWYQASSAITAPIVGDSDAAAGGGAATGLGGSTIRRLAAGDYLYMRGLSSIGGTAVQVFPQESPILYATMLGG